MLSAAKNDRGVAFVVVIFISSILLTLVGTGLLFGMLDLKVASSLKSENSVFYVAEAGLQHGWQELANNDGVNDFVAVFNATGTTVMFSAVNFGSGSYTVSAQPIPASSPNQIQLTSTACLPAGNPCPTGSSKAVVGARVEQNFVPIDGALRTNGNLRISGNPNIMGTCGKAHTNGSLDISGNPGVQMTNGFTASASMAISGNPCVGSAQCGSSPRPDAYILDTNQERTAYSETNDQQPSAYIPTVNPADFAPRVAALGSGGSGYILHNDGTVGVGGSCGADGLCAGGTVLSQLPVGWEFISGMWQVSGSAAANGVFYAETAVRISGNVGSVSSPWQATIIARDSINWSSNPVIQPFPTTDAQLQGILVVTGNDLSISGNAGINGNGGAMLVHQQIGISGNATIHGFIVAGDGQPTWAGDPFPTSTSGTNLVSDSQFGDVLSGNPSINFSCSVPCNNPACSMPKVKMLAWKQPF